MYSHRKSYIGQVLGEFQAQAFLSLWSWVMSPSQYVDVFTNLEDFKIPHY